MKKNRIPRVSESELELLKFLWDQGPATVRDLRALARRKKIIWAHTTILTLLRRLETKGCVAVDRDQVAHIFSAAVDRDELLRARLDDLTTDLCDGAPSTLVQAYMSGRSFTKSEARELKEMVDHLNVKGKR